MGFFSLGICLAICGGVPSAEAAPVLTSQRLAIGLNTDGSLVTNDRSLGIMYDPDGGGFGDPMGMDMIVAGYPFETWSLEWSGGDQTQGGPHLDGGVALSWGDAWETMAVHGIMGSGSVGPVDVQMVYDLLWDVDLLFLQLKLTARSELSGLHVSRTVDPDPDYAFESYASINESSGNGVYSEARYAGKAMALVASGGVAGVCSGWCTKSDDIRAGAGNADIDDSVIGVTVEVGAFSAGETKTLWFVYGFGMDGDEALDLALWGLSNPDRDGDGRTEAEGDCNDRDAWVSPDQPELADGTDNDCDGEIDEGTVLFDDDGDGYTEEQGDCDDAEPNVYPGADPVEGVSDADCDGLVDEGDWTREGEQPEGWGVDPDTEVELVRGACNTVGLVGVTPWIGCLLFFAIRRRGGDQ